MLAGGVMGFMALGRKAIVDRHCEGGCDAIGDEASRDGRSLATASTVAMGVGVTGFALGGYLLTRPGVIRTDSSTSSHRSLGLMALSVGAVGLVTSGVAAAIAVSAQNENEEQCGAGMCAGAIAHDARVLAKRLRPSVR